MNIKQIDLKIEALNRKKQEILSKQEKKDTIVIDGIEYEAKTHDFNKVLSEIQIPKGWRLWKPSECYKLWENEETRKQFNLGDCWFFVRQPIKAQADKRNVARFYANLYRADLDCGRVPTFSNSALGVRFCRKKVKGTINKDKE